MSEEKVSKKDEVIKYPKGSEWFKWDLHCHTPDDKFWLRKPSTEEEKQNFVIEYIKKAKDAEIKVLAITNHYEYKKIKDSYFSEIKEEGKKEGITVLPGVEITASEESGIHILAIFSEETDLTIIDSLMIKIYPIKGTHKETTEGIPICACNILQIYEEIKKALESRFILIFAHVNTNNGVISSSTGKGGTRVQAWQHKFMRFAQWTKNPYSLESGTFNDRIVRNQEPHYKREIIHIVASDCRSLEPETNKPNISYLGEKYTWIKTNPSFEGLLQIFYDSEDKIAYQEEDPRKRNKQFFKQIQLGDNLLFESGKVHFFPVKIPLNHDMITIIGSRGTGKSILLDVFAKLHDKTSKYNENINIIQLSTSFLITYQKEPSSIIESSINQINELDYIHVHQSEFKQICIKPLELDKEIRQLLGIPPFEYSNEFNEEIDDLVNKFFDIRDWFHEEEESGELKHSENYNKEQIKKYENKIGYIRTSESQEQIERFRDFQRKKLTYEAILKEVHELKLELNSTKEKLNPIIENINSTSSTKFQIPSVDFQRQIEKIDEIIPYFGSQIVLIQDDIEKIKEHFQEIGIEDVDYVMDQVKIYENAINQHNKTLKKLKNKKKEQDEIFPNFSKIVDKLQKSINEYKGIIDEKWKTLKEKELKNPEQAKIHFELLENIEIIPEIYFDGEEFNNLIIEYLNKNKFRKRGDVSQNQRIRETFNVYNFESFISLIQNDEIITFENSMVSLKDFLKKTDYFNNEMDREFFKNLYKSHSMQKFCKVISKTRLNGREIGNLSMGERGTLFLRIKLATAAFSLPFIFDQPEDDLDNDFIQHFLVRLFKKLKKYRQIIVATHNANIVVNSNSEQVIIADNHDEILHYISGGLEDPLIRTKICDILEGGELAFQKRARKYGLS